MTLKPDDDLTLPRSTIDKIVIYHKLSVPRSIRHHLTRFADQFILETSLRANILCENEKRKTISHEHIMKALKDMGYDFESELLQVYDENINISKMRPSKINKLKNSQFTLEELKMQQDKLFENARKEYENMEQSGPDDFEQNNKELHEMDEITEDKKIYDTGNSNLQNDSIEDLRITNSHDGLNDDENSDQIGLAVNLEYSEKSDDEKTM